MVIDASSTALFNAAKTYRTAMDNELYLSRSYNIAWHTKARDPLAFEANASAKEGMAQLEKDLDKAVNTTEDALTYLHMLIRSHSFTEEDWARIEELL